MGLVWDRSSFRRRTGIVMVVIRGEYDLSILNVPRRTIQTGSRRPPTRRLWPRQFTHIRGALHTCRPLLHTSLLSQLLFGEETIAERLIPAGIEDPSNDAKIQHPSEELIQHRKFMGVFGPMSPFANPRHFDVRVGRVLRLGRKSASVQDRGPRYCGNDPGTVDSNLSPPRQSGKGRRPILSSIW